MRKQESYIISCHYQNMMIPSGNKTSLQTARGRISDFDSTLEVLIKDCPGDLTIEHQNCDNVITYSAKITGPEDITKGNEVLDYILTLDHKHQPKDVILRIPRKYNDLVQPVLNARVVKLNRHGMVLPKERNIG